MNMGVLDHLRDLLRPKPARPIEQSWPERIPMRKMPCREYDPPGLWCAPCRRGDTAHCIDPMRVPL